MNKVTFSRTSPFYDEVRAEVEAYFTSTRRRPVGDYRLWLKSALLLSSLVILYCFLLMNDPGWLSILGCAVLGFVLALIGFNVMHDACHGSYSSRGWVNSLMGYSMNILGSNQYIWKIKHNRIHHTYTNVDGVDDDIIKVPVLRHCKSQPYKKIHRYQHIYGFLLYALSSILWVLVTDTHKYLSKQISGTPIRTFPLREHIVFWLTKIGYVLVYMVIPAIVVGFVPWLVGYLVMNVVFGLTLSIVFQLAHAVEETNFEDARSGALRLEKEWAAHQVETTADFATSSPIANWLLGGLNFQVVHHLFPNVSHVHYRSIQPIVARVSARHGIRYYAYPTMWNALRSHVEYLKGLGKEA